ncbi:MAG: hypothetical protein JETCAE02_11140 [Anaerolineaceae bacterium]|jgi:hypothetical protein|nr:hypothetical protein [Anaerolineales bacterium]NOG75956.1 hypothetical protein [Chloroflexota bacterium]GJQ38702.1 MAG: hypothetical protein JETCAE02_11140 [Anaerolineaceae bacterium]WKZ51586.1 MAG: hypothetical protein QY329_02395 [Anaerolineales bacterium]WKZ54444.1 MAG: hypothetical protein QY324_00145 [Anaerolineales bacterium]
MTFAGHPLRIFLSHIIPLRDARADRDRVHALYDRLTKDGVDIMPAGYAWLDKV